MSKLIKNAGATDVSVLLFIEDSSNPGDGLTGLVHNSAGLTAYYVRPGGNATVINLATQTVTGAHADGGFVEIHSSNMPGWYRLDLPDALLADGVDSVGIALFGATNMVACNVEVQLLSTTLTAQNAPLRARSDFS